MDREVMSLYLIHGLSVTQIAKQTGAAPSRVRGALSGCGIRIRRLNHGDSLDRESVCAAAHRKGYTSFYEFIQVHGLESFGKQAKLLEITEKSLVRIYESCRRLLGQLEESGRGVPSSQGRPIRR
jgi:hypothetical protein